MSNIKLFESKKVHTYWDEEKEKWFFSVIDVVENIDRKSAPPKVLECSENQVKS